MNGDAATVRENSFVLEVEDLSVEFPSDRGTVAAVRGVGYRLRAGEVLGVVGESGSGKSVSALAVMGLLPRHARVSGSARYHGAELLTMTDKQASAVRGNGIAMIFQNTLSTLTPVYTIGEHIAEALRVHRDLSKRQAARRAVELLDLVGIPDPGRRAETFPHECSGGMSQRVMIAMAIANEPDVIVADEPTAALDVTVQAQILEVLRTARDVTGAGILMITHDLGVIAGIADRVQVMYAGRVVESGSVDDLFHRPRMPYTVGLLNAIPRLDAGPRASLLPIDGSPPSPGETVRGCPFRPRCPVAVAVCGVEEPALRELPVPGEPHRCACHRSEDEHCGGLSGTQTSAGAQEAPGPPDVARTRDERRSVLTVDGLVKRFPAPRGGIFRTRPAAIAAVDGVSFDVREGEALAIVGESGCGKTTTLLEALELTRPQHGRIVALGQDTSTLTAKQRFALRRGLQVIFQDPTASLNPRMPVGDIVAEPLHTHGLTREERQRRVPNLLTAVGLDPRDAERYPHEFSGGQRQRIAIARALALRPRLLVLDEPVSALDMSVRAGIINLLVTLRARHRMSYLLVSHDLAMVRHLADRVAVMYLGRIVEIGSADRVFEAPAHPYTQGLLSAVPIPDPRRERDRKRILLQGEPSRPGDDHTECRFRARCPRFPALGEGERRFCLVEDPCQRPVGPFDHRVACHHAAPLPTP